MTEGLGSHCWVTAALSENRGSIQSQTWDVFNALVLLWDKMTGRLGCNQRVCDGFEEAYISWRALSHWLVMWTPDKPQVEGESALCLVSGFTMGFQAIYTTMSFYKAARWMSAGKGSATLGLVILDNMEFICLLFHIKRKIWEFMGQTPKSWIGFSLDLFELLGICFCGF